MSLDLDKRQRAMLREMGIRLWQPLPEPVAPPVADAAQAVVASPVATAPAVVRAAPVSEPVVAPTPAAKASSATPAARAPTAAPAGAASAWIVGDAQALYAESLAVGAPSSRWLLLVETHSEQALPDPLSGEVGKLLDNMLKAVQLHQGAEVWLVPVLRQPGAAAVQPPLLAALTELMAQRQPDVLLIMGRLAAQALLQSTEPLGKLRGQLHDLQGTAAVVTYDAASLLRNPADKSKAWDDLCLALQTAQQAQARRPG